MIEHKQDYPVYSYLCKNDVLIDWEDITPDEILYIPENLFNNLAKSFITDKNIEANMVAAREIINFY